MNQTAFTIVTEIRSDGLEKLKNYLRPIGKNVRNNEEVDFNGLDQLHYCCFAVIEDAQAPPILLFEGNIDGSVRDFLVDMNGRFLRRVYAQCVDCPEPDAYNSLTRFLLARDKSSNAFYVAHPGRTVIEIKREHELREKIERHLDEIRPTLGGRSLRDVQKTIQIFVEADPELTWTKRLPRPPLSVRIAKLFNLHPWVTVLHTLVLLILLVLIGMVCFVHRWFEPTIVSALGIVFVPFGAAAGFYLLWLRSREKSDNQDDSRGERERLVELQDIEDRQLQNHLMSVTCIKPGWLRLLTLRAVLWAINLVARFEETRGKLAGIVTIHFARWLIVDGGPNGGKRLLFFSNYDGSWENYLGEFVDQASVGLTAVWSNTQLGPCRGFPNTKWLVSGGAQDEQRFKAYTRNSQRAELIWYSAYPNLSVKNIGNNHAIREGLFDEIRDPTEWLRRF